ncbi:MAG: TIGR01906 family membrane protein [Anaerolineae bacterium]
MENKALITTIRWIIVILTPFVLGTGIVRGLIAWDYPAFEYSRIAPDDYGFTLDERLALAHQTLDYLQRPEPASETIYLLEEMRLPDSGDPVYNERELGHMIDVKVVADAFRTAFWIMAAIVVVGYGFLLARPGTRLEAFRAMFHGGIFTTGILIVIGLFMAVAWSFVFTQFHNLFFDPGTWVFYYTDSLIRLFPEQFWLDFGIIWAGLVFVAGLVDAVVGFVLVRRGG